MPGRYIKKKVKGLSEGRFHCEECGHLLAKGELGRGRIEFKCGKCLKISLFETIGK